MTKADASKGDTREPTTLEDDPAGGSTMESPLDEGVVGTTDGVDDDAAAALPRNNNATPEAFEVANYDRYAFSPTVASFHDHFTLKLPSSTVRYRDGATAARVIESTDAQFVLEETYDEDTGKKHISIRSIGDTAAGAWFLRIVYVIVTAFWTGFLFVFCLQVLLFLFLDLALAVGATSGQEANWGAALGVILSIIPFVYGLASAMVIAGAYIMDTWKGHPLIRNFTFRRLSIVAVEWIFFAAFLGVPIFIFCFTLLAKAESWWTITSLVWFSSVLVFYCIFVINVVWYEMRACWMVTKNRYHEEMTSWFHLVKRSILLRQVSTYSGRKNIRYLSAGTLVDAEYTDKASHREDMVAETRKESISWRAKITRWPFLEQWGLYEDLETPERVYSIDDARDVRPFITAYTWSLEKVFCRPKDSRYIAIVSGPGAITRAQMKSSVICSFLGTFLIFFVLLSGLVYAELGAIGTIFILACAVLIAYNSFKSTWQLYTTARTIMEARGNAKAQLRTLEDARQDDATFDPTEEQEQQSEAIYLVQERYRITRPTERGCWIMFVLEIFFLIVWPLLALFRVGNWPLGITFCVAAGVSAFRYYVNAAVVLEETGHMQLVDGANEKELWASQARLNEIVGNITRGRSRGVWISVLGALGFVFLALFLGAIGTSVESEATTTQSQEALPQANVTDRTYLDPSLFEYRQTSSLRYPTCQLTSGIANGPLNTMADYAFLAGMAYRDNDITQNELDIWFGEGECVDHQAYVDDYRTRFNMTSRVIFKLVSFPNYDNWAYVLIRGTTNNWDMLTDAQLWASAALMQVHRMLLPFGEVWTPIIDQLIKAITTVESEAIDRVSFYKDTVRFTNYVKADATFGNVTNGGVSVTGHSLGGGLSIITGAQTETPAVALSGPNAVLSRRSFDPPVSLENLDRYTFNIIPERDVVPMIDDRAQNYQVIRCQAAFSDFIGCHTSTRSLCEILSTCGSRGRPVPCYCNSEFYYRPPSALGAVTFQAACNVTSVD